jgi:hypothetical protein
MALLAKGAQSSERTRGSSVCLNLCSCALGGASPLAHPLLRLPPTHLSPTSELEPGWLTTLPQSLATRVKLDETEPVVIAVDEMPVSGRCTAAGNVRSAGWQDDCYWPQDQRGEKVGPTV